MRGGIGIVPGCHSVPRSISHTGEGGLCPIKGLVGSMLPAWGNKGQRRMKKQRERDVRTWLTPDGWGVGVVGHVFEMQGNQTFQWVKITEC